MGSSPPGHRPSHFTLPSMDVRRDLQRITFMFSSVLYCLGFGTQDEVPDSS